MADRSSSISDSIDCGRDSAGDIIPDPAPEPALGVVDFARHLIRHIVREPLIAVRWIVSLSDVRIGEVDKADRSIPASIEAAVVCEMRGRTSRDGPGGAG